MAKKTLFLLIFVEKIPLDELFPATDSKSPMNIEISFQMPKKGLDSVCCFGYFGVLKKSEHIRQSLSDNRKTSSYHFVSIPIPIGFQAVRFFIDKIFMLIKPIQKFFYPILFLRFIINEMKFAYNFPQFKTCL